MNGFFTRPGPGANTERTGHVLNSKLRKYFVPTLATAFAISLDEFVDSILVANLLDMEAMTVISVARPVTFAIAATYVLFGIGGSTLYAMNIGSRDKKAAGRAFSVALSAAMLLAVLLCVLGTAFSGPICRLLCGDEALRGPLEHYVRVQLCSAPLIIGIQTLSSFFPAAGVPRLSTMVCGVANAVNLVFDYVYIGVFHAGVGGAAYATMTGYVVCLVLLAVQFLRGRIPLCAALPAWRDYRSLPEIAAQGTANALGQVGYGVKFAFCNGFFLSLGGPAGLAAFALANQLMSIMGIGLQGISDATVSFLSTLKGQKDTNGIRYVLRAGMVYNTLLSAALMALFMLFPGILYTMFNVTDPAVLALANGGLRIFLPMFLVRGIYILYMSYARIVGRKVYSVVISLLDGFALLIPVALLCARFFGMTGAWVAFPLNSVLILLGILVYNRFLARRSGGKYSGFFLMEREEGVKTCDMTIGEDDASVSLLSERVTAFCAENGVEGSTASHIGLLAEEMAVYTRLHREKSDRIDILLRIEADGVTVDFRSEGQPFNPLAKSSEDSDENISILNKIPSEIAYDYMLGMNSTRFTVRREKV